MNRQVVLVVCCLSLTVSVRRGGFNRFVQSLRGAGLTSVAGLWTRLNS